MELTCSRCHQTVETGTSFCSYCGLPQLVYSAENPAEAGQPVRWNEAVRDASAVMWRPALQSAISLAIPAGVLCAFLAPVGIFGLLLMGATGAWAVSLYMRRQRPAWITIGAGARIGLVTGILSGWTAAATAAFTLYAMRYWFDQGQVFDQFWNTVVAAQMNQQFDRQMATMGNSAQAVTALKAWMLSPDGRAAWVLCAMALLLALLLASAAAGGALGARMHVRRRHDG